MSITAVFTTPPVTARDTASREATIINDTDAGEAPRKIAVGLTDTTVTVPGLTKGSNYTIFFNDTDKAGNRSLDGGRASFIAADNTAPPAPEAPAFVSADEVDDAPPV